MPITREQLLKEHCLGDEDYVVSFGALSPLPDDHAVIWSQGSEHFIAIGPDGWEGSISCDRFWCRRQALWHVEHLKEKQPA